MVRELRSHKLCGAARKKKSSSLFDPVIFQNIKNLAQGAHFLKDICCFDYLKWGRNKGIGGRRLKGIGGIWLKGDIFILCGRFTMFVQQKPTQKCKVIILQLKITKIFFKTGSSRSSKIRIKYLGLNKLMRMKTKIKIK